MSKRPKDKNCVVEPWFSVEEISLHLGISKETVYRWLDRMKIPAHRIGRLWKFKPSEVDEWIRAGGAIDISDPQPSTITNKSENKITPQTSIKFKDMGV